MPIEEYGKLTIASSIPVVLTSIMTLQLEGFAMSYYHEWKRDNIEKKSYVYNMGNNVDLVFFGCLLIFFIR